MDSRMGSRNELSILYVQLVGWIIKLFGLKMTRNELKHVAM
jgi:hypothetical protein